MLRRCLFLLLIAAWYYCAEMAEAMGGDIKRTQYLYNGIFGGAVLTLAWSGACADRGMRSLALLAGYLWLLHPVCVSLYTATATGVTSVCNVVLTPRSPRRSVPVWRWWLAGCLIGLVMTMNAVELHHGDCLDVLRGMADNSMDSIVTDPPYGLSLMGRKWDYDVPSVEIWAECLRVLKPGGHLLAFAGTRTQHRMACRIEDGGFEIRDMIAWVYGSGFPKHANALKPALEPITMARKPLRGSVAENVLAYGTGGLNIDGCRVGGNAGRWPANLCHDGSPEVVALFPDSKGQQGAVTGREPSRKTSHVFGAFAGRAASEPRGDTGSAARFFYATKCSKKDRNSGLNGFDLVIIEPLANAKGEKWASEGQQVRLLVDTEASPPRVTAAFGAQCRSVSEWNTLLFGNEHTAQCLTGSMSITGTGTSSTTGLTTLSYFQRLLTSESTQAANCATTDGGNLAGSAASGTTSITSTSEAMASVLGAGLAACATLWRTSANAWASNHPTVKPTDLMRYLCRLVTPPGGVVLDPFMGSGSTGKAAVLEGFRFVGIEREAEYVEIARARIGVASG